MLGASIVPLGVLHVVGTRLAHALYDVESGYPWVLGSLVAGGWTGIVRQFALPLVVWMHACIGLHFAWRLRPWYRDWLPMLYAIALLVPAAGIAGAAVALARRRRPAPSSRASSQTLFERAHGARRRTDRRPALHDRGHAASTARCALLVARARRAAGARPLGAPRRRRPSRLQRTPQRRRCPTGLTILEMSRIAGIPHASVCGGRGRCSTCRVRIARPRPRPAAAEPSRRSARCWRASARRRMSRLACQPRPPPGHYRVTPLLPAAAGPLEAYRRQPQAHGGER